MRNTIVSAVVLVAITCVIGCRDKGDATATTGASSMTSTTKASTNAPLDGPRQLALADPHGSTHVDQQIFFLQKAVKSDLEKPDGWIILGRAWVRKARESADPGFYLNANASADVALQLSANNYLARDLKALVLLSNHKFEEARAFSQKIVNDRPDDAMGYGSLCDALLELGRFEEAATAAQTMIDLKPNLPSYSRAAWFRWLEGDVEQAKEYERKAIDSGAMAQDPEPRAWELVQSTHIFWNEGDYEGADAGCDLALTAVSEYPAALAAKGRVALSRGDAPRAVELLTRAYAVSPLTDTAWLLGDARTLVGDAKGADEAYANVEKEGRRSDSRALSYFWSAKNKNAAESLALAQEEKKTRGDIYTDDVLAWALYRNHKIADAKAASDHALRHGTKDARLLFHNGAIRIAMGGAEVAKGRAMIRDALVMNPHFDVAGAAEARALIGITDGGTPSATAK